MAPRRATTRGGADLRRRRRRPLDRTGARPHGARRQVPLRPPVARRNGAPRLPRVRARPAAVGARARGLGPRNRRAEATRLGRARHPPRRPIRHLARRQRAERIRHAPRTVGGAARGDLMDPQEGARQRHGAWSATQEDGRRAVPARADRGHAHRGRPMDIRRRSRTRPAGCDRHLPPTVGRAGPRRDARREHARRTS